MVCLMMKRIICAMLLVFFFTPDISYCQTLAGFSVLDSAFGDLNKDGIADKVVVYKSDREESEPESARPLFVFHGTIDSSWVAAGRNDSLVMCASCGGVMGDPYMGISIESNTFSVYHYGGAVWRWSRDITFFYHKKQKQYILKKDTGTTFNAVEPNDSENDIYNKKEWGKVSLTEYRLD